MQGWADHSYLVQEKEAAPQGGLQSQYWGAQATSYGIFSTQHYLNQCTLKEAKQKDGSAKGSSTSARHPVSCTVVYQHTGPSSGGHGQLDAGGAAGEPGMVQSPGAMWSSDFLAPELSLSNHILGNFP